MRRKRGIFQQISGLIWPVAGLCLTAYFVFHTIEGDRGLMAWIALGQRVEEAKVALADEEARAEHLRSQVARLRDGSLDPDLLDERARVMSGMARPGEILIPYSDLQGD